MQAKDLGATAFGDAADLTRYLVVQPSTARYESLRSQSCLFNLRHASTLLTQITSDGEDRSRRNTPPLLPLSQEEASKRR